VLRREKQKKPGPAGRIRVQGLAAERPKDPPQQAVPEERHNNRAEQEQGRRNKQAELEQVRHHNPKRSRREQPV
jgi:hypothetical protein